MPNKKYELDDEALDSVTGGLDQGRCPGFLVAAGKLDLGNCDNCFYWIYDESGNKKKCDSPNMKRATPK